MPVNNIFCEPLELMTILNDAKADYRSDVMNVLSRKASFYVQRKLLTKNFVNTRIINNHDKKI